MPAPAGRARETVGRLHDRHCDDPALSFRRTPVQEELTLDLRLVFNHREQAMVPLIGDSTADAACRGWNTTTSGGPRNLPAGLRAGDNLARCSIPQRRSRAGAAPCAPASSRRPPRGRRPRRRVLRRAIDLARRSPNRLRVVDGGCLSWWACSGGDVGYGASWWPSVRVSMLVRMTTVVRGGPIVIKRTKLGEHAARVGRALPQSASRQSRELDRPKPAQVSLVDPATACLRASLVTLPLVHASFST
jgi:hypothetical protein